MWAPLSVLYFWHQSSVPTQVTKVTTSNAPPSHLPSSGPSPESLRCQARHLRRHCSQQLHPVTRLKTFQWFTLTRIFKNQIYVTHYPESLIDVLLMTETGSNYFLTFLDTFLMTLSDLANGIWLSWRGPDPVAWLYLRTSNDDYENLWLLRKCAVMVE